MKIFSRSRWQFGLAATFIFSLVCTLALVLVFSSHAATRASGPLPPSLGGGDKTYHYGPFASTSPDSSTCGGNWANDTFQRFFTVHSSNPNLFLENFSNGKFTTIAGPSPNACVIMPGPSGNGNTVAAGVTGNFYGSFDVQVTGGVFNPNARCTPSTCNTTAGFVQTVYGCTNCYTTGATFFEFDYYTEDNGSWHNASTNEGGDNGDITGPSNPDPSAPIQGPSLG